MMADSEGRRAPATSEITLFICVFSFASLGAYSFFASARRAAQFNAIASHIKGESDCRILESMYLDLEAQERTNASKLTEGSEKHRQHFANADYYKKMAADAHRIAKSNAATIRQLKQRLQTE